MEQPSRNPVPETLVAACAATALTLVYSAPTPGAGSRYVDGRFADPRGVGYLIPFARAALLGETSGRVLARLDHDDLAPFLRALEAAGDGGPLAGALKVAP